MLVPQTTNCSALYYKTMIFSFVYNYYIIIISKELPRSPRTIRNLLLDKFVALIPMVGAIPFLWRGTIPYTANNMYLIFLIMASNLTSCGIVPLHVETFPGSAGSIPLLSEIP